MEKDCIITVDWGGTKILACAINSKNGIIKRVKKATKERTEEEDHLKDLADSINELIEKAELDIKNVKAVCIGIPGSVNPYSGRIALAPNLGLKDYPIKEKLQKILPFPVLIENDVNLGGLGIKYFGLGKDAENLLTVFVGTGIGGALFFNGKIYRGSNFYAGEIGHFLVEKNGPLCGCGNRGCFEAVASRTAIAKNITSDLKKDKKSILNKYVKPGDKIKSKALAQAIKKEDKLVIKHISAACETIGIVLANVANLLNLDMIVLGGGLIEALDKFMIPHITESFEKHALKDIAKEIKILPSKLGDDAAIYGGLALAAEFLNIDV